MKGFKDFLLRGNLVELAIAFIMAAGFAAVVEAFTKIVLELLAKAGGAPNFDSWQPFGLTTMGPFLTALIAFIILAFVVYFFLFKPYQALRKNAGGEPSSEELLTEIRDLLAKQSTN